MKSYFKYPYFKVNVILTLSLDPTSPQYRRLFTSFLHFNSNFTRIKYITWLAVNMRAIAIKKQITPAILYIHYMWYIELQLYRIEARRDSLRWKVTSTISCTLRPSVCHYSVAIKQLTMVDVTAHPCTAVLAASISQQCHLCNNAILRTLQRTALPLQ